MNQMSGRRKLSVIVSLLFLCLFITVPAGAATVTLNKVQTSVYVGKTVKLAPTSGKAKNWRSSKPSIATVSSSGVVTGRRKGTSTIYCTVGGKTLKCTMNVRNKNRSKYVTNAQAAVWLNVLGAVESGGMVYGHRDYACFANPGENSPNEASCTGGAYQEYGESLRELLIEIRRQYPVSFNARDKAGIATDIKRSWEYSPYTATYGSSKGQSIRAIISCNAGAFVQDLRACELLDEYIDDIKTLGVTNLRSAMLMAECEHLGGFGAVKRVVNRASNRNSMNSLLVSLFKDQNDYSSSYQIGDSIYRNRHNSIANWLKQYIPASAKIR